MFANTNIISCNFSSFPIQLHNHTLRAPSQKPANSNAPSFLLSRTPRFFPGIGRNNGVDATKQLRLRKLEKGRPFLLPKFCCFSSLNTEQNPQEPFLENEVSLEEVEGEDNNNNGGGGEERDWTSSVLLSGLYAGLLYYVFVLAPDQTPSTDMYFVKKLLNVIGDDGFKMNEVLVALWYIMGLFPLVYSMLLIPSARSEKNSLPVWPFLALSFFLGAYGLIPYFILWRPPPSPVDETELRSWPLNFLDSKLTAGVILAAGLGLMVYAGLSNVDVWKEFYLYFRSSRFIHAMSIDFALLSTFAPFWVYNDMTARKWYNSGSWLLPVSLVPLLGPALYLLLRPPLSSAPALVRQSTLEDKS